MEQLDRILKQVIIEILVHVQQEVHADLLGLNDLLDVDGGLLDVSHVEGGLHQSGGVPAGQEVVVVVDDALPAFSLDDLLGLVVHVVNGGVLYLALNVPEGVEHGHIAHSEATGELVVVAEPVLLDVEHVLGLTDGGLVVSQRGVDDVVVVMDPVLVLCLLLVLRFVRNSHQSVVVGSGLPQEEDLELDVSHSVLGTDLDSGFDLRELSLGVFFEVEVGEDELLVVLVLPDQNLGVVVALGVLVLVGPLSVLTLPSAEGLAVLIDAVVVKVGDDESGVVGVSAFDDAEVFGFGEGEHLHGAGVVEGVLVVDLHDLVGLEVDDIDFAFGDVADDDFLVVEHAEEVDDVVVLLFEEDFAGVVGVDDGLLGTGGVNAHEDEGILEGD